MDSFSHHPVVPWCDSPDGRKQTSYAHQSYRREAQVPREPKTDRANPAHEVVGINWGDFKTLVSGSTPRDRDRIVLECGSHISRFQTSQMSLMCRRV